MLDTIVYIPTILAYAFISLLVIILCFIVVYISHKIYVCIYDNLPVAHAALSTIISMEYKDNAPSRSQSGILLRSTSSLQDRKPKTALRIIVALAPTYLAYMALDSDKCNKDGAESDAAHLECQQNKFIKYYDRLSQIPMENGMSACTSERQLLVTPRRLRQKSETFRRSNVSNNLDKTTDRTIKSVGTSTTRLTTLAEETSNYRQEPAVVRASGSMARPAVTFANAVNALANTKLPTPEETQ